MQTDMQELLRAMSVLKFSFTAGPCACTALQRCPTV